ncbi:hypothetical protein D5366_05575 [Neokomagataea tanensis]|uniref:Uncharacterized protein n=1 Tax=Neokomagataea tanensis TaxID=661191 RepID=A0A4Y6V3Z0_9PROT|nr:hypothetical protein D5366_05575 [Neokomagataea tanensis]
MIPLNLPCTENVNNHFYNIVDIKWRPIFYTAIREAYQNALSGKEIIISVTANRMLPAAQGPSYLTAYLLRCEPMALSTQVPFKN